MGTFKTEQEEFWAGNFGDDYSRRNTDENWAASNLSLFSAILHRTEKISSLIEFGANIGLNLKAIQKLLPNAKLDAIEINKLAASELKHWGGVSKIYQQSILDFKPVKKWDFVLIKGVLIHINPAELNSIYQVLVNSSRQYICIVEYYNPVPVEVPYRGHAGKLFKRDFAGEILDQNPNLRLVDYGFVYRRDSNFPQDDCTWFLLEKPSQ